MSKHTPGPWQTHSDPKQQQSPDWLPVWDNTGLAVATVWAKDNAGLAASNANARLIAAAPDMLEALEASENFLAAVTHDATTLSPTLNACLKMICAAIAKATNGS